MGEFGEFFAVASVSLTSAFLSNYFMLRWLAEEKARKSFSVNEIVYFKNSFLYKFEIVWLNHF